jgi:hypothetical protein
MSFGAIVLAQNEKGNRILAPGQPPLTQNMVDHLASIWQFLLDVRLTDGQNERLQKGFISYWTRNDRAAMDLTLANLKYFGQKEELTALRDSSQQVFVESMRREPDDLVSIVLLEAFDSAHSDKKAATRAKGFTDLVGTWKRQDGVLANRGVGGPTDRRDVYGQRHPADLRGRAVSTRAGA